MHRRTDTVACVVGPRAVAGTAPAGEIKRRPWATSCTEGVFNCRVCPLPSRVVDDDLTIKLTRDQAVVLSDWLDRMIGTPAFDGLVNEDRAVWSPLHTIAGTLDRSLAEVFMPDYTDRLHRAQERLLDSLGDVGGPPSA